MGNFDSMETILNFAIDQEKQAYKFYKDMASRIDNQQLSLVFEDFAAEEKSHEQKLLEIKKDVQLLPQTAQVTDLKISDYSINVTEEDVLRDSKNYVQKAYLLAMKKEKAAFKMYSDLAQRSDNENIRKILLSLAQEEARHKLKLEIDYEDHFFTEN